MEEREHRRHTPPPLDWLNSTESAGRQGRLSLIKVYGSTTLREKGKGDGV